MLPEPVANTLFFYFIYSNYAVAFFGTKGGAKIPARFLGTNKYALGGVGGSSDSPTF